MASRWGVACLALTLGACSVHPEIPVPSEGLTTFLAARLEAEHAAGRFDGLAMVVRVGPENEADEILLRRAFGEANRERGVAHDLDRPFRWASVSKQVTAVLVMQAVSEGRLELSRSVAEALPGFAGATGAEITVEDLLRHRSGLPNPDDSPPLEDGMISFYRPESATAPNASDYCAGPPEGPPGAGFEYNNCDYVVLQEILEGIHGRSFEAIVRERLAEPLGLASLRVAGRGTFTGYLEDGAPEPPYDLRTYGAGGALTGTIDDLWAFDRALLGGDLLPPAARDALWAGDPAAGYVALGAWSFEAQPAGCPQPLHLVERQGAIGGLRILNLLAPERRLAVILVSNTAATDYGAIWQGSGLAHDLLRAAACPAG